MGFAQFSGIPNEYPVLRKDLWSVSFPVEMNISETFEVRADRPKWSNSTKAIKYKNFEFKYKGAFKVEDMKLEFRDVVGPSVGTKIWAWQREHNDPLTGCGSYASVYKKNLTLSMEDECGNVVEQWILYGCFITAADWDTLDMEADADPALISLTLAYDYPSKVL